MENFKLATFNTNSIRARLGIITEWIEHWHPDVLCLQETKVQDRDFPSHRFQELGYESIFRGQKSYNGVAIISRHPLNKVRKNFSGESEGEARFVSAEVEGISVANVYVPQGYSVGTEKFEGKLRWLESLLLYVREEYSVENPLILAGDFNVALEPVDVYEPERLRGQVCFHPDEQSVLRKYLAWGFVDLLRKHHKGSGHYTFWDYRIPDAVKRGMGWRVDYIFATPVVAEKCRSVWIDKSARMLEKPSDHTFLVAEFADLT